MNILLNWFPPAYMKMPSPGMSILKGYLNQYEYNTYICYWNLILKDIIQDFTIINDDQEAKEYDILVPFLATILLNNEEDKDNYYRLCTYYQMQFPWLANIYKPTKFTQILQEYTDKIQKRFFIELNRLYSEHMPNIVGVNISLLQLIPANIFSELSKNLYPNIPIVVGGISSKNEAIASLNNFSYYDFAIWGEGENPLHQLCRAINQEVPIEEVPNLAYRIDQKIVTNERNRLFPKLENCRPDYSDYFNALKANNLYIIKPLIPIESSRGCHWNKCKFCFLADGYRIRAKSNDAIIKEILQAIEEYDNYDFIFLDNDIIFNDFQKFDNLLDCFIGIKQKHEQFGIWNGEVITKGLNAAIIKKMTLAGFKSVQIGYEALSDNLLAKINKKNSFSSNLMFVKWASEYNLNLQGLNIITDLIDEEDKDIIESIHNLHFLRFFLNRKIHHTIIPLLLMRTSRYYNELKDKNELKKWDENLLFSFLPNQYIKDENKHDIMFFANRESNFLWKSFEKINEYYSNADYRYKVFSLENGLIYYSELYNGVIISELEFDISNDYHWNILQFCNKEVKSIQQIMTYFNIQNETHELEKLKTALLELNEEYLLYSNTEFSENISIINTDIVL